VIDALERVLAQSELDDSYESLDLATGALV
jgi:hypothetical protein